MPEHVPAALWPEVDRIALCVHRPTGRHPLWRATVDALQLPGGAIVVTAGRHLVAGRVSFDDLQQINRYESRTAVAANMERHVELGFLERLGDAVYAPTPAFRDAALLAIRLQAASATELWAGATADVAQLAGIAEQVVSVAAADAPVPTPAFAGQVARHATFPEGAAAQLLAHVTELRYLRSDLHAAVLARHDLAGPRARALHRLWRGGAVSAADGERLETRGLAEREGGAWVLTPLGRSVRDDVEVETDVVTDEALRAVPAEQLERFLAGLIALPGSDPRLEEDR